MFEYFNRNTFATYLTMPLLLLVLRLRLFIEPRTDAAPEGLYTPMWQSVFGGVAEGSLLSIVISLVLIVFTAYTIVGISNAFRFTDKQSSVAGLFYIIYSGGFVISQGLHPVHVFGALMMLAFAFFLVGTRYAKPMLYCFNGAMLVGIAWLFWAKTIWFLPVMFAALIMLRERNFKCLMASLMGLVLPLLMSATWWFVNDSLSTTLETYWQEAFFKPKFFPTGLYTRSYLIICGIVVILSLFSALGNLGVLKIVESRQAKTVIMTTVVMPFFIITSLFSFEMLTIAAQWASITTGAYVFRMRNRYTKEAITLLLFVASIYIQWKMHLL